MKKVVTIKNLKHSVTYLKRKNAVFEQYPFLILQNVYSCFFILCGSSTVTAINSKGMGLGFKIS